MWSRWPTLRGFIGSLKDVETLVIIILNRSCVGFHGCLLQFSERREKIAILEHAFIHNVVIAKHACVYLGAQSVIIINLLPNLLCFQSVPIPPHNQKHVTKETPLSVTTLPSSATTSLPTFRLCKLRCLSHKLLRNWQPEHDVQLDGLLAAQELDLLGHLETESTVEFQIERVAAFEVADAVFDIGLYSSSIPTKKTHTFAWK